MTTIRPANFHAPALHRFLEEHLADMAPTAPAESRHALDLSQLDHPGVRMWVSEADGQVLGTIALAALSDTHEELKSMRTAPEARGTGIATGLLQWAIEDARARGVTRVSLETGSMDFFAPARSFYAKSGFVPCTPFADYTEDPNSVFMTLTL